MDGRVLRLALVLGVVLMGGTALDWARHVRFAINETDSLPNWAFVIDTTDRSPRRGDLAAFVAPPNPYYRPGVIFCKVVYGVPGDRVERIGRDYYVAGRFVGRAKAVSQTGRQTTLGPTGVLPAGRYFVGSPHPDGYDSRYADIGWIAQTRIVGRAAPVL